MHTVENGPDLELQPSISMVLRQKLPRCANLGCMFAGEGKTMAHLNGTRMSVKLHLVRRMLQSLPRELIEYRGGTVSLLPSSTCPSLSLPYLFGHCILPSCEACGADLPCWGSGESSHDREFLTRLHKCLSWTNFFSISKLETTNPTIFAGHSSMREARALGASYLLTRLHKMYLCCLPGSQLQPSFILRGAEFSLVL